ncbi:hypothetical protein [Saccharopolyspora sp. NPDC050642]|uniref:hypothetical protein n=1 Tax=Saccharopolyspora sp. NPDC050642 TaxID=3157099 RepID=UPI0033CD9559
MLTPAALREFPGTATVFGPGVVLVQRLRDQDCTVAFPTLDDPAAHPVSSRPAVGGTGAGGAGSRTVIQAMRDVTALRVALRSRGTVVAYEGGRWLGEPRAAIAERGAPERSVRAEHLGAPGARVLPPSEVDDAPYLSTVVVLPRRGGRGEQC